MCFAAVHVRCSRECLCMHERVARMSSTMTGTNAKGFTELDSWSPYLNRLKV